MISEFDYQEHASEWGTHWNFYTTIAVISLAQNFLVKTKYALGSGIAILLLY